MLFLKIYERAGRCWRHGYHSTDARITINKKEAAPKLRGRQGEKTTQQILQVNRIHACRGEIRGSDLIPQDLYLSYPIPDFELSSRTSQRGLSTLRSNRSLRDGNRRRSPLFIHSVPPHRLPSSFLPFSRPLIFISTLFLLFSSSTANSTAPANWAAENSLYKLCTQADQVLSRRNRRKRYPLARGNRREIIRW